MDCSKCSKADKCPKCIGCQHYNNHFKCKECLSPNIKDECLFTPLRNPVYETIEVKMYQRRRPK